MLSRVQVTRGVMYTQQEAEGKRLKNPFDTITEGIGINRQTQNFSKASIDGAFKGTDREAVEMVRQYSSLTDKEKLSCHEHTYYQSESFKPTSFQIILCNLTARRWPQYMTVKQLSLHQQCGDCSADCSSEQLVTAAQYLQCG